METMEEVAAEGIIAQANIDRYLSKAYKAALRNVEVTERGVELGMARDVKAKLVIARARAAAGSVALAAEIAAELHQLQVEICQANDVDLGNLTTAGGITIGGFSTEGGGR